MQTIALLVFFLSFALLILIAAIQPRRSRLSTYELDRRDRAGDASAKQELQREVLLDDVSSLKRVLEAVLFVVTIIAGIAGFGLFLGAIIGVVIALFYGRISQFGVVVGFGTRLYESQEARILQFVERHPTAIGAIRSVVPGTSETLVGSRQEIEYMIEQSSSLLSHDEKQLLLNGLHFNEKKVEDIMTPRGVIETVPGETMIGPLVLDELHKTGHSRFPVIDGDIDHVVGVLHIKELLTLGNKESQTAKQVMEQHVYYINQEQTLDHALAAFIKTRHHLFVVVNGYRETAGILTLEDVIEALLGREIVDEFDVHDDLRVVAERSARTNNNPPHATTIR